MSKLKKFTAVFLILICLFSTYSMCAAKDYDEESIYNECYTLYPDFVNRVKSFKVTDKQIIVFLGSVEQHLSTRQEELSEENFDEYMFDAIKAAFNLRKNIPVRDALAKAYPDAVSDAMNGTVPDEYMPIYITVKRILFGIVSPVVTLSGDKESVLVHHLHMPEDARIIIGFYDSEGNLLHAHTNPQESLSCDCEALCYAKAFAFKGSSLMPLCESYTLNF